MTVVEQAGSTHPGLREGENEDVIGWDEDNRLWLVADGMGGHASGQVASAIARDVVLREAGNAGLDEMILAAHEEIRKQAESTPGQKGMGATLVVARLRGTGMDIAWVGDSRAYLMRDGELRQITVDHSFVEMLRARVGMSEEELRNHPQKHILTQTLGHDLPTPSASRLPLRDGDRILLCSDGLNDEVAAPVIAEILRRDAPLQDICDALVEAALENGGSDNVSVVVIEYHGRSDPDAQPAVGATARGLLSSIAAGVGAAVAALLLFAWVLR